MAEESKPYILDTDQELDRLAKQHELFKDAMRRLVLAPVDLSKGSLNILDSATADGIQRPNCFVSSQYLEHV